MADFEYTYSAPQQEEIRRIRQKYQPREETALDKLRRLDREAERLGKVLSLILGVIGALVFGTGMSCCLVWAQFITGIAAGIVGAAMLALAYPVYRHVTRHRREKIAPQILALTEELERG